MPTPLTSQPFDAAIKAAERMPMPTALDTAGLRGLGPEVLARAVFCAHGASAVYASKLKEVVEALAAGDIGEGQARTALWECLKALGYTPEGGFPDAQGEVPQALKGTLQDLSSFRRLDLIVRTQMDLMSGAGEQMRGHTPDQLAQFPAWELIRVEDRQVPRDWPARWTVAGGKPGAMIALKGDPVWGELGSYDNFSDALGVDHPPFAFLSGMGWRAVSAAECEALGITGPDGETPDEWLASGPIVMAGKLPLPSPRMSMADVDPAIVDRFRTGTGGTSATSTPGVVDYSDVLARELAASREAYQTANPDYKP